MKVIIVYMLYYHFRIRLDFYKYRVSQNKKGGFFGNTRTEKQGRLLRQVLWHFL
jgi:hypothetical protein